MKFTGKWTSPRVLIGQILVMLLRIVEQVICSLFVVDAGLCVTGAMKQVLELRWFVKDVRVLYDRPRKELSDGSSTSE